jgi:formamidopyrimidine-DNA glycosylase
VPELPDLTVYTEHLQQRLVGQPLRDVRLISPFVLRTVEPPPTALVGRAVTGCSRLAKQLVIAFEGDLYLVIHLMIAGRLQWRNAGAKPRARLSLALFDFDPGTLELTEASRKRRAAMRVVAGADDLAALDPGGLEVLDIDLPGFSQRLRSVRHTLKRALTDQRVFAGIGNAYSDEILLRAQLSPFKTTANLTDAEVATLYGAVRSVLQEWTARLRAEAGDRFPAKVTAFHPEMAVHGKYREPCPHCGAPVQRIAYAENEANYCARCQTAGRLLADRSLSRLLKDNWPKRLEDLE